MPSGASLQHFFQENPRVSNAQPTGHQSQDRTTIAQLCINIVRADASLTQVGQAHSQSNVVSVGDGSLPLPLSDEEGDQGELSGVLKTGHTSCAVLRKRALWFWVSFSDQVASNSGVGPRSQLLNRQQAHQRKSIKMGDLFKKVYRQVCVGPSFWYPPVRNSKHGSQCHHIHPDKLHTRSISSCARNHVGGVEGHRSCIPGVRCAPHLGHICCAFPMHVCAVYPGQSNT